VTLDEADISPAKGRHEPGTNPAEGRQSGTSPAEGRQPSGVSLQEAALQLDVSERTVRRLIRDGEVQAYKQKATRGFVWRVVLDSSPGGEASTTAGQDGILPGSSPAEGRQSGTSPAEAENPAAAAPELMKALEIIEDIRAENHQELEQLRQENKELTAAASHWQARAQEQERRATHAEEQIKLLMAPKDEPITDEPQPRRWWQRIFS
jgi:hypothetical protein